MYMENMMLKTGIVHEFSVHWHVFKDFVVIFILVDIMKEVKVWNNAINQFE